MFYRLLENKSFVPIPNALVAMMDKRKKHECLDNTLTQGQPSFSQDLEEKEKNPGISVVILAYRSGEGIHTFVESPHLDQ